jgi:hypothetical protein
MPALLLLPAIVGGLMAAILIFNSMGRCRSIGEG